MIAAPGPIYPWPIGEGRGYHPTATNAAVVAGKPVGRMRCASGRRYAVHVELFAHKEVAIVPPQVGVAASGCHYPLATAAPTGVVDVLQKGTWTLGDLFRVWGRRLTPNALLSFRGRVSVYVGGKRRFGDPRSLVLTRHAEIVIETGGYVAPHPSYLFPKGEG